MWGDTYQGRDREQDEIIKGFEDVVDVYADTIASID